jgi:hypothetical protein
MSGKWVFILIGFKAFDALDFVLVTAVWAVHLLSDRGLNIGAGPPLRAGVTQKMIQVF